MVWYLERTALRPVLPQVSHGGPGKNDFIDLVHELARSINRERANFLLRPIVKGLLLDARTEKEPSPLSFAAGFQNSLVATPPPPISLFKNSISLCSVLSC